jgi:7-carboxy-7-deazaguanine synthase
MFGKNEKIGQKHFEGIEKEGKVSITSIFGTLQGEGPYSGRRAIFVRLAQCQLACSFCDTYFSSGDSMTVEQVERKVLDQFAKFLTPQQLETARASEDEPWSELVGPEPIIVFTGGEPGLQMPMLEKLVKVFHEDYQLTCQIESNGIIPFTDYIWRHTTVVISPKCAERDGIPTKYIKPHAKNLSETRNLKFVVTSDLNSPYSEIPQWAIQARFEAHNRGARKTIYVSPMNIYNREPVKSANLRASGVQSDLNTRSTVDETISFWEEGLLDMAANQKNHEHAAKLCMETGSILSLQTHLYASLP